MHDARSSDLARRYSRHGTTAVYVLAETAGMFALSTVASGLHRKGFLLFPAFLETPMRGLLDPAQVLFEVKLSGSGPENGRVGGPRRLLYGNARPRGADTQLGGRSCAATATAPEASCENACENTKITIG